MGQNTGAKHSPTIHDLSLRIPAVRDDVSFYLAWEKAESAACGCVYFKISHDLCKTASSGLSGSRMTVETCVQGFGSRLGPRVTQRGGGLASRPKAPGSIHSTTEACAGEDLLSTHSMSGSISSRACLKR